METGNHWINKLELQPHPEGGHYKRTYCSNIETRLNNKSRHSASMIYFLLNKDEKSHFHRLKSDEIWIYQRGSPAEIYIIDENGSLKIKKLGFNSGEKEELQIIIPANCWFAAKLINQNSFILMTCMVTPSFDFEDFELANEEELIRQYPEYESIIKEFSP